MDKQSQNELRVFKKFAQICPYSINLGSIEKRNPPEPDILCKLSDEAAIAFEIVECIDRSLARSIVDFFILTKAFYDEVEKLPDEKKHRVKSKFSGISIKILFHKGVSLKKKICLIKPIFDQLWTMENEEKIEEKIGENKRSFLFLTRQESQQLEKEFFEILEKEKISEKELLKRPAFSKAVIKSIKEFDLFDLKLNKNLRDEVKRITFRFLGFSDGPSITEDKFFVSALEKRIRGKLKKKFKTKHKTELLVYYEVPAELLDWMLPDMECWIMECMKECCILPAMVSWVDERLENSIFKRVWLYSVTENKIMYVFPNYLE